MSHSQSSLSFEPEICKNCVIKSICTKNFSLGTLCSKAYHEIVGERINDYLEEFFE